MRARDVVAIILATGFAAFFWLLAIRPSTIQEVGVSALKDVWLVVVGALAAYIAGGNGKSPP